MDFNVFYSQAAPFLGTGTIAGIIIAVFAIIIKAKGAINDIRSAFKITENEALKAFKNALPKELSISLEALAKTELAKITESINQVVNNKFLSQIKANTELMQAVASALITMKAIPDSAKKDIAKLLEIKDVKTTESLKIELLPVEPEVVSSEKVLID
jgi:hypothetical protein